MVSIPPPNRCLVLNKNKYLKIRFVLGAWDKYSEQWHPPQVLGELKQAYGETVCKTS